MRQIVTLSIAIIALGLASCDTRNERALEAKADAVRDSAEAKAAAQEMTTDSVSYQ